MVSKLNKLLVLLMFATPALAQEVTTDIEPIITESTVTSNTTTTLKSPPPSAISPTINTSNSDLCTFGVAGAIQTQILGLASGMTVTDENCERIKLSRSLYGMGMKVAAVSTLCQDPRVFDAMWMSGTPCPYMGDIGDAAKVSWEKNLKRIPKKSLIYKQLVADNKQNEKDWNEIEESKDDYTLSDNKKQKSKHNVIPMVITALAFGVAF